MVHATAARFARFVSDVAVYLHRLMEWVVRDGPFVKAVTEAAGVGVVADKLSVNNLRAAAKPRFAATPLLIPCAFP